MDRPAQGDVADAGRHRAALIRRQEGHLQQGPPPRLRIVQRLDKETSGLVVFARTVAAERGLGKQFHAHTVHRRYVAVVPGWATKQTIRTRLVRDRGDGRRGSTTLPEQGKEAITHIEPVERLPGYTLVACRLETGRTHQIRIHLAELGHPVCGERVYGRGRVSRRDWTTAAPRVWRCTRRSWAFGIRSAAASCAGQCR